MWISQKAFLADRTEFNKVVAERDAARQQTAVLTNTLEWLQVRVTQLEMERAVMINVHYGVKIPTPVLERAPEMPSGLNNPLNAVPSFADMGDDAALKEGVSWNEDGSLVYTKKS